MRASARVRAGWWLVAASALAGAPWAMAQGSGTAVMGDVALALRELQGLAGAGRLELERSAVPTDVENGQPVDSLSLAEAKRLAWQRSHALGASEAKARSAKELARASYAGVLPSVDLRLGRGREQSTPSSQLDEQTGKVLPTSKQTREEVYGVLTQPLFDLGAVQEIRRASATRRAAESDATGARVDVGYELASAYFNALEASLTLKLARAQQQRLEKLGSIVANRAQAGGASGADRERIRARVLAAKAAVEDARSLVTQSAITLGRLTGTAPRSLALPPLVDVGDVGSLDQALGLVPQANPAVVTARENEEAARHERSGQLAHFTPVVKLEVSDTKVKNAGGIMGWKEDQRAMVVLTMPLLSGGADFFRQRALLAKQEQYEQERLEAERAARQNLQIAFSGLAAARQKLESLRQQADAQQRVVRAFDAQLTATNRNLLDVFDAYQQYHQSQLDLTHTSVQALLLAYQVKRVTGQLASAAESE